MTNELGTPCWNVASIDKAIASTALVREDMSHYFLASHTPVERIHGDKGVPENLNEQTLFEALLAEDRSELLAVVSGDPGTGKSHLIHWLKLRCQQEQAHGRLSDVVPVLIARGDGSLKHALEQMISELGEAYRHHLDPVKAAVASLSVEAARERLAFELAQELGERGKQRGRTPLPRKLRELREACASAGFRAWLCRAGGTIDQYVQRLTAAGAATQPETELPTFKPEDVRVPDTHRAKNSPEVRDLINDLLDDDALAEEAARAINEVTRHAVAEMTGLRPGTLRKVFEDVRRQLRSEKAPGGQGKRLAVFIEDVSTMSILDTEVFNAFEARHDPALCRMVAVLGMVTAVRRNLAENFAGRAQIIVSIGTATAGRFDEDPGRVERFTARYLNTVRLDEAAVRQLAQLRSTSGGDVPRSACAECPVREECHSAFGSVELGGGVRVGLFPFTPGTAYRLLTNIRESAETNLRKNPRGLLDGILSPVLRDHDALARRAFPHAELPVPVRDPMYWTNFERAYTVTRWSSDQRQRLRRFAAWWIDAQSADEAAAALQSMLKPLGFPRFSKAAAAPGAGDAAKPVDPKVAEEQRRFADEQRKREEEQQRREAEGKRVVEDPAVAKLQEMLNNLRLWMETKSLSGDEEPRKLLAEFVRTSVRWVDQGVVPPGEWRKFLFNQLTRASATGAGGGDDADAEEAQPASGRGGHAFVRIDGQQSRPPTQHFFITFPHGEETRLLIEALARFQYEGRRSWDFPGGEDFKRTVAQWLRCHEREVIEQMRPKVDTADKPLACAVQFLSAAAVAARQACPPSNDPAQLVAALLDPAPGAGPGGSFTPRYATLAENLVGPRRRQVREFVLDELDLPQGRTGRLVVINPVPLVRHARAFLAAAAAGQPRVDPVAPELTRGFWQSRYLPLAEVRVAVDMAEELRGERDAIVKAADGVVSRLGSAGYADAATDVGTALAAFAKEVDALVKTQRNHDFTVPDRDFRFDQMVATDALRTRPNDWAKAVKGALMLRDVGSGSRLLDVLAFNSGPLRNAVQDLETVHGFLELLEEELAKQEEQYKKNGDPGALEQALLAALTRITEVTVNDTRGAA